jgi:uncharacterized protein (DUF983 family)
MDQQSQPAWKRHPVLIVPYLLVAAFFLFGDFAMRAIWHMDFWLSMLLWAGIFSVLLLALHALTRFLDS